MGLRVAGQGQLRGKPCSGVAGVSGSSPVGGPRQRLPSRTLYHGHVTNPVSMRGVKVFGI